MRTIVIRRGVELMARNLRASIEGNENVVHFPQSSMRGAGEAEAALNLVYQAADVLRRMENHARETAVRAQSLCKSSAERLRQAEMRTEVAERAQRELVVEMEHRLQDAASALAQAEATIEAQEDKLLATEFRAQAAETEARDAKQALALVEEAIRRRLLPTNTIANARFGRAV